MEHLIFLSNIWQKDTQGEAGSSGVRNLKDRLFMSREDSDHNLDDKFDDNISRHLNCMDQIMIKIHKETKLKEKENDDLQAAINGFYLLLI